MAWKRLPPKLGHSPGLEPLDERSPLERLGEDLKPLVASSAGVLGSLENPFGVPVPAEEAAAVQDNAYMNQGYLGEARAEHPGYELGGSILAGMASGQAGKSVANAQRAEQLRKYTIDRAVRDARTARYPNGSPRMTPPPIPPAATNTDDIATNAARIGARTAPRKYTPTEVPLEEWLTPEQGGAGYSPQFIAREMAAREAEHAAIAGISPVQQPSPSLSEIGRGYGQRAADLINKIPSEALSGAVGWYKAPEGRGLEGAVGGALVGRVGAPLIRAGAQRILPAAGAAIGHATPAAGVGLAASLPFLAGGSDPRIPAVPADRQISSVLNARPSEQQLQQEKRNTTASAEANPVGHQRQMREDPEYNKRYLLAQNKQYKP